MKTLPLREIDNDRMILILNTANTNNIRVKPIYYKVKNVENIVPKYLLIKVGVSTYMVKVYDKVFGDIKVSGFINLIRALEETGYEFFKVEDEYIIKEFMSKIVSMQQ